MIKKVYTLFETLMDKMNSLRDHPGDVSRESLEDLDSQVRAITELGADHVLVSMLKASRDVIAGNNAAALSEFKQLHKQYPDHPALNYIRGTQLANGGDSAAAIEVFERAVALLPPLCDESTEESPDDWEDERSADEALRAAMSSSYMQARLYHGLAEAYLDTNRVEAALESSRKAEAVYKPWRLNTIRIAYCEMRMERYEEAVRSFRELLEEDADDAGIWSYLGYCLDKMEDYEDALQAFRRSAEVDPSLAENWTSIGVGEERLGNHERALAAYEESLKLDPEDPHTLSCMGYLQCDLEQFESAKNYFDRALALEDNLDTAAARFECDAHLGNVEAAIAGLEALLQAHPDEVDLYERLGKVYANTGQTEESIAIALRGLEIDPDNTYLLLGAGISYANLGRFDEARKLCVRLETLDPVEAEKLAARITESMNDSE